MQTTTRHALPYSQGTDDPNVYTENVDQPSKLSLDSAVYYTEGTLVSRPSTSVEGDEFYATDTYGWYKWLSGAWELIGSVGDSGWIKPTCVNSWSLTGGNGYRKVGSVNYIDLQIYGGPDPSVVFSMPAAYSPVGTGNFQMMGSSNGPNILAALTFTRGGGNVAVFWNTIVSGSAEYIYFTGSYLTS